MNVDRVTHIWVRNGSEQGVSPVRATPKKRQIAADTDLDVMEVARKKAKPDRDSLQHSLCDAVSRRDVKKFHECMSLGADINGREKEFGYNPVGLSMLAGSHRPMLQEVLKFNPDVNQPISWDSDKTPLLEATYSKDVEGVRLLLNAGASLGDGDYRESLPYQWAMLEKDTEWSAPYFKSILEMFDHVGQWDASHRTAKQDENTEVR